MKSLLIAASMLLSLATYASGLDPNDSHFPVIEFDHRCMSYDIGAWKDAVGAHDKPILMLVEERPSGKRVMVGSMFEPMDLQPLEAQGINKFIEAHVKDWNNYLQSVECSRNEYPEWTDYLNKHLSYDKANEQLVFSPAGD